MSSRIDLNIDEGIRKGRSLGCEVVQSSPNTLLLDLDTEESYEQFTKMRTEVEKHFPFVDVIEWRSRNGNRHVKIVLENPVSDITQRLLLQAVLGSDLTREFLSLLRYVKRGAQEPSLLFRPKTPWAPQKLTPPSKGPCR